MENYYGPELNDGNRIFVFGSNESGRHGKGAALEALKHWGACYGKYSGLQGQSYAIPTKNRYFEVLPIYRINSYTRQFIEFANQHPKLEFLITKVGYGLAGYSDSQIGPLFAKVSENCHLPEDWLQFVKKN